MRLDKYLWAMRYFKTRSLATEALKKGKARIGDQIAKPSREVFPGDVIALRKEQVDYVMEVIALPESRVGAKLLNLYRTDMTPPENLEVARLKQLAQSHYRERGTGRPTKKDRRALEQYTPDAITDALIDEFAQETPGTSTTLLPLTENDAL
jgi:ribosome-associated heat shock protein Hsp15